MLLNDTEVEERLNSTDNLVNRLNNAMGLFGVAGQDRKLLNNIIPTLPSVDDVIDDPKWEDKLKSAAIKRKATDVIHDSLSLLHGRLGEVEKVKDLANIAAEVHKIISKDEDKKHNGNTQVIVYKPVIANENNYDSIVVHE